MKYLILVTVVAVSGLSHAGWESEICLADGPGNSRLAPTGCAIATGTGTNAKYVHLAWLEANSYDPFRYRRSKDYGATWEDVEYFDYRISDQPSIAADGKYVHIVYLKGKDNQYSLCYLRSKNNGVNWENEVILWSETLDYHAFAPYICAHDGCLHITWGEYKSHRDSDIYYIRSTDNGATWGQFVTILGGPARSGPAKVAAYGDDVHLVSVEYVDPYYEVIYKHSSDKGATWEPEEIIAESERRMGSPDISCSGTYVHVALSYFNRIAYLRSTNSGDSWDGLCILLSWHLVEFKARFVRVCASGDVVHFLWYYDERVFEEDTYIRYEDFYYTRSIDNGILWEPTLRITSPLGGRTLRYPSIHSAGSILHTVWIDNRNGNWDVYYRRNNEASVLSGIWYYLRYNPRKRPSIFRRYLPFK